MRDIDEIKDENEIIFYGRIFHYSKKALSDSLGTLEYVKKSYYHLFRQIDVCLSKFGISPYKRQDIRDYIYEMYHTNPDSIGKKYGRINYYVTKTMVEMYGYNIVIRRINSFEDEDNKLKFLKIIKELQLKDNT